MNECMHASPGPEAFRNGLLTFQSSRNLVDSPWIFPMPVCQSTRYSNSLFFLGRRIQGPFKHEDIINWGHPRKHTQNGDPEPLTNRVKVSARTYNVKCQIRKARSEEGWVDVAACLLISTSVCPCNSLPHCPRVTLRRQTSGYILPQNIFHRSSLPPGKNPKLLNTAHKALHDLSWNTFCKPSSASLQSTPDISVALNNSNLYRSQVISVPRPLLMQVTLPRKTTSFLVDWVAPTHSRWPKYPASPSPAFQTRSRTPVCPQPQPHPWHLLYPGTYEPSTSHSGWQVSAQALFDGWKVAGWMGWIQNGYLYWGVG